MDEKEVEHILTEERKLKKRLSIFPFIIRDTVDGKQSIWTGKWFSWVIVKERKQLTRYLEFDDGWSYQSYWGEWKEEWLIEEIITDENKDEKENKSCT